MQAGTPRPIGKQLLESFIEACSLVGYDKDVIIRDKNGKPVINESGNPATDETKRIQGLIPYLQRTAELHRPEALAILGKILAPLANSLHMHMNEEQHVEKEKPTREQLERQLAHWGIRVNIFHGDEGRRPMKLIDQHERPSVTPDEDYTR